MPWGECRMSADFPRVDCGDLRTPPPFEVLAMEPTDRIYDYRTVSTGPDFGCIHHAGPTPSA